MHRVVITGVGMVSPLGINVSTSWNNLLSGKSGLIRITERTQNQNFPDIYMGLIPKEFDFQKWSVRYCNSNLNAYTMAAVDEAIIDSNINFEEIDRNQCGVNIGIMNSNVSQLTNIIQQVEEKKNYKAINRFTMLHVLSNMPTANVSIKYQLKGPSSTACTACATGCSAIGDSYRRIQLGEAKLMLAGGSEDTYNATSIYASIRMSAMSTKQFPEAFQASRPFDRDRSGFILSEGSGIVILEEFEHAIKRKAKIYGEIIGYGESSDGFHLTRPQDNGEGGLISMQKAIKNHIQPEELDLINCHATSTEAGDLSEVRAISNFGARNALITANKGALGHTFGAAGAIESIFTLLSMKDNIVPKILNLDNPINGYKINYTRQNEKKQIKFALKNAFGFGGVNVSLLFRKWQENEK